MILVQAFFLGTAWRVTSDCFLAHGMGFIMSHVTRRTPMLCGQAAFRPDGTNEHRKQIVAARHGPQVDLPVPNHPLQE